MGGFNQFSELINEATDNIAVRFGKRMISLPHSVHKISQETALHIGRKVFLGIRPEAFFMSSVKNSVTVKIQIQSVEFVGHETLIYFQLTAVNDNSFDNILIARVSGKYFPETQSKHELYVHPRAFYLFNKEGRIIDD